MTEYIEQKPKKLTFSQYVNSNKGKALISNAIRDPRKRDSFTTAIISAVSNNPELRECESSSIISAALQGVSMGLAPSPQLGQFYMIPFEQKEKKDRDGNIIQPRCTKAQFVCGYKGYVQLAFRSGQYLDLDARAVVEGEYRGLDRYTGKPIFEWIEDDVARESLPVTGYMAYFELVNGARKVIYWSKEKMLTHADKYSKAFNKNAVSGRYPRVSYEDFIAGKYPKDDEWKYSSFWYKDFDGMALKTMLRQLITKWGPVSIEMETAITQDEKMDFYGADYEVNSALTAPSLPQATKDTETTIPVDAKQGGRDAVQSSLDDFA